MAATTFYSYNYHFKLNWYPKQLKK